MKQIIVFTDGSCYQKTKQGGIGVYMKSGNIDLLHLSKGYFNTTISRMEMRALLYAIKSIPIELECELIVYADSQFVVNSFNEGWLKNWKRENYLGRLNSDLWKQIDRELQIRNKMKFKIIHTRGHRKDLDNEIAQGNYIADALCAFKQFSEYEEDSIIK